MDFSACVKFVTENPVTSIATAEGDQPRVRTFAMWFCDMTGFYYHTVTPKNVCRQLKKNPKVELCLFKPGEGAGTMMRVAGKVEFLKDKALEERLYRDRSCLKETMAAAPKGGELAIFRVAHGKQHAGKRSTPREVLNLPFYTRTFAPCIPSLFTWSSPFMVRRVSWTILHGYAK